MHVRRSWKIRAVRKTSSIAVVWPWLKVFPFVKSLLSSHRLPLSLVLRKRPPPLTPFQVAVEAGPP
jgi:hypothetical protein